MIRAVIVEDSRLARLELSTLLQVHAQIQLVGEAASAQEGVKLIQLVQPDLVFLDIDLGGKHAFNLLAQIDTNPAIIFTTAFDQYALKSFDYNTVDYLLKPIVPLRLEKAIEKAEALLNDKVIMPEQRVADKIFIQDRNKTWLVALNDIYLFESKGNYTQVFFKQNRPLILKSLQQMYDSLDKQQFIRVNRQQIINVDFIQEFLHTFTRGLTIKLRNGDMIAVSRRQVSAIKKIFGM